MVEPGPERPSLITSADLDRSLRIVRQVLESQIADVRDALFANIKGVSLVLSRDLLEAEQRVERLENSVAGIAKAAVEAEISEIEKRLTVVESSLSQIAESLGGDAEGLLDRVRSTVLGAVQGEIGTLGNVFNPLAGAIDSLSLNLDDILEAALSLAMRPVVLQLEALFTALDTLFELNEDELQQVFQQMMEFSQRGAKLIGDSILQDIGGQ